MWTLGCEFSKTYLARWRIKAYTAYTWWWNLHFQTANICKCVFFPVRNSYSSQLMPAFKTWSVCNWWHCFIISWSFCKTLASCRSVWSLLYFFRMLYLGVLADRHLFLCQACVTAKIEPYLTVLEEKDVQADDGDAEWITPRTTGDSTFSGTWRGWGCMLWWTQPSQFFSNLCLFGALGSLSPRCHPMSLPRHLWAQIWIYRSCSYQCSWDFQCSNVWLPR